LELLTVENTAYNFTWRISCRRTH